MNSLSKRVVELDSKKRELLKALLEEQNVDLSRTLILPRKADGGSIPPSFAQERLWFLDRLEPGTPSYNEPFAISLTGQLDIAALVRSINEILKRHDALRTSFSTVEGLPVQIISPQIKIRIPIEDLSHFDGPEREKALRARMTEEAQKPFDLTVAPLLRFMLVYLGKQEHILQLTIHHIISDAWSIQILMQELAALYEAFSSGKPSPLPALPIQYADFALWQRQWLRGEELEQHVAYWKKQLGGALPVLELATDRPRPAEQTFNGRKLPFGVPAQVTEKLKALSRRQSTTLFMTLLAAFQVLLHRYTSQEDIIVGSPTANRNRSEIGNLIGFFSNILPLRIDMSGNPSFLDLLSRVREVVLEAYAHQDTPFEKLVDALQPVRDPSRTPLFQAAFELQDAPIKPIELPGLRLGAIEVRTGTAKFDLALHTEDMGHGLRGAFEFNTDLFDLSTIERMAGHYVTLLDAITTNPALPISDLSLLTTNERRLLLEDFNRTSRPFPADLPIHELFQQQARLNPNAVAVASGEERLSYGELNRRANQLGHYLRKQGVGRGVIVGILMPRGIEQIVSVLGVLKAGGAYVPLDGSYPMSRLAYMIEDAEVSVLMTKEEMEERMPAYWGRVVRVDEEWEEIGRESEDEVESGVRGRDVAYVIYTSGSTGMPKGVMVEHCGLVNLATWHQRVYDVREEDRATQLAGLAFDASIWEIWPYFISGASIHIPDEDTIADPSALMGWLVTQEITLSFLPTPLAEVALGQQWPSGIRLRALLTGGDKLHKRPSPDLPFSLINHYGPTENTVVTTCATVSAEGETFAAPPIGRPIDNTQAYVLDRNLLPVPVGVPGELLIGGNSLARGYMKQPDLTADRFLPNPFSAVPGARMYSTGDIVRYLPDGNIEFLGRKDYQVKIRGFRIELGDIEAALSHHKAVREAAVLAREDLPGEKRLVGYVVAHQESPVTTTELRAFLKERLPDYMVPASFVMLDSLPLTPNGKIDRRALPRSEHERPEQQKSFVAPRSAVEQTLAEIWTQVLHVDSVGIDDNFFELGGDSILGVQLIARANQAGLRLTPRQLFQHQTVAELAAVAGTAVAVESQQGPVTGELPLTPIQAWFFEQDYPEPHHFNQAILLEVRRPGDADALSEVVRHIMLHHDSLRLRFSRSAAGWTQQIAPPGDEAPFSRLELTHLSDQEQAEAIERYCSSLQASFNLSEGPLVRVALIETGPGKSSRLLMAIHNLAVDGVSWRILLSDIQSAYEQLERGEPIRLPSKTTSYKSWAERLAQYAQSEKLRDEASYWLSESRMRAPRMAVDFAGGDNTEASAREVRVSLSAEETWKLLHEALEAYHTEINDVLLAALALAYAKWTGARSLLLDIEGHGREEIVEDVDLSRTVGWFTTIFPVHLDIEGATSQGEVLRAVKQQLRQIPNRGIGFGLLKHLGKDPVVVKKLRELPRAEMNFNYLGQFDQALSESSLFKIAGESAGLLRSPKEVRPYLLEVNSIVVEGRLQLIWIYSENLHRRETVERFAQLFVDELRSLIENSGRAQGKAYTASDFPLASLDEQELSKLFNKLDEIDEHDTSPGE